MKIALVGPIDSPVVKNATGGTEMWTYDFAEALVKAGHDVTLFASEGSNFSGKTVYVSNSSEFVNDMGDISRPRYSLYNVNQALEVLKKEHEFDLVHFSVFPFYYALPISNLFTKPMIFTIHGYNDFDKEQAERVINKFNKPHYVFVSNSFANHWPEPENYSIIRNGINLSHFAFSANSRDYYFWIGRISESKNILDVIEFAEKSNQRLIIAGPIGKKDFFEHRVRNRLNQKIEYVGTLSYHEKVKYFQQAKALLFPIKINEPLPLVVLESLACGTPILSYNTPPMEELVIPGETGYISKLNSVDELVNLSKNIGGISRRKCRQFVEKNFNVNNMVKEYLKLYQMLTK